MLLVRQDLTKPSDAAGEYERGPQNADTDIGDEARCGKRAAEGQDDGPCSGCRQTNGSILRLHLFGLEVIGHVVYLPTRYTTVKTTTHTASTKCQ